MKVTVITVCYNSESTIRDTIESVLGQDYSNIEYIIIDGASQDGTMAIVREYRERIDKVVSETDLGIYDAMNKGVRMATGDVVGILNSDDIYFDAGVISHVVTEFSKPDVGVVFGDLVFVDRSDLAKTKRYYASRNFKPWKLRFGWMPPHPASFIRRKAYEQFGLYKTHYKIAADYEMFVRMLWAGNLKYARIDKVLVKMRMGGVSTAGVRSVIQLNREIVQSCLSNNLYSNLFFVTSKLPFKLLEFVRRPKME